ncbi:unnamed protein product [Nippostrongylus brasiliensis]|uniref:Uncharacterized protein n=1 Tax=Nippostrongylus brasiliensis TaxID=27835 RepID=A0A0N4XWY1_NIPBR|nr:unnamed protein product [Nippostrongylus brasiliensis]
MFLQDHFWSRQPYEAMRSAGAVDTNDDIVAAEASLRDQKILNAVVAYALWRNRASFLIVETSTKEAITCALQKKRQS